MDMPKYDIREAVGYLKKSGKSIRVICPFCGWVHTFWADGFDYTPPCKPKGMVSGYRIVRITELKAGRPPKSQIIEQKNRVILESAEARRKAAGQTHHPAWQGR